jgi:hypothetical protein
MLVVMRILKLKKQIILFCFVLVTGLPVNNLFSQNIQKPTRQSSFEAFSQGNYEKAYNEFRELLLTYSKDPLYKYYSGVCLVKLKRDPAEATNLLQQAIQGAGSVKTLPSDGLFYLGCAQQMSGKFADATVTFNSFAEQVGKKTAKEMGVPQLLQECSEKKGQVIAPEIKTQVVLKGTSQDSIKSEVKPEMSKPVQKTIINPPVAKESLPANYEKILGEAIELQFKADSVTTIINGQKKELEKLTGDQRSVLKAKIAENEKLAAAFQALADKKYREAQFAMHPELDTTKNLKNQVAQNKIGIDSTKKAENQVVKSSEKHSDTAGANTPSISTIPMVGVFSFFDVSGKPETDPKAKITIDPEVPPGLIYRIQIAVFRNPVALSYFKGLNPVYGFKIEGTDKIIYYVGMFRKSADAAKALVTVKSKGFKDAFVAPLLDNKRVSSDRASALEKEWGGKPFYSIEKTVPKTDADTITPTLTFRVDVIRSLKPLTEDVVDGFRKTAGSKGLDIQLLDDEKIDYIIGKFITFETAAAYADLLKRNGYREAQVSAWLGKKEISIDTARKLTDNLK